MKSLQHGVKDELGIRLLMQACGNCAPKVGCITECEWLWHRSCSKTFTSNGNAARTISLTGYLMAILLAIVMAGNGLLVVAQMLRRITESLIQLGKASSSIQMVNTFANTSQSLLTFQVAQFMNRGMFLVRFDHGYPEPIVDHAAERLEALDRLSKLPKGVQVAQNPHDDDLKIKPVKKAAKPKGK
jgi:hypothetical protein